MKEKKKRHESREREQLMCNIQLYQQAIVDPCKEVVLCLTGSKGRMNLDPGKIAELLPDIPVFVTLKTGDTKHFLYANLRSFAMPDVTCRVIWTRESVWTCFFFTWLITNILIFSNRNVKY